MVNSLGKSEVSKVSVRAIAAKFGGVTPTRVPAKAGVVTENKSREDSNIDLTKMGEAKALHASLALTSSATSLSQLARPAPSNYLESVAEKESSSTQSPVSISVATPSSNAGINRLEAVEELVLSLVNKAREGKRLEQFKVHADLIMVSGDHSKDMLFRRYFSHKTEGTGEDVAARIKSAGLKVVGVAENIQKQPISGLKQAYVRKIKAEMSKYLDGIGVVGQEKNQKMEKTVERLEAGSVPDDYVAQQLFEAWKNSKDHWINMIGNENLLTGLGVYADSETIYATQVFVGRLEKDAVALQTNSC